MRTITISGWGQPHDALLGIAPNALCVDYARHKDAQTALADIRKLGKDCELAVGWSLGGQLLVRAIAARLIAPKKLVLIAAPFQFVARPELKIGMPADLYKMFRDNYASDPARTLAKAWATIVKGDARAADIRRELERHDKEAVLAGQWLKWLDILQAFSCSDLPLRACLESRSGAAKTATFENRNASVHGSTCVAEAQKAPFAASRGREYEQALADFPPTLLIHGREDAVVFHNQSLAFAAAMPKATLHTIEGCGHAPHWHSPAAIQQLISDFTHV